MNDDRLPMDEPIPFRSLRRVSDEWEPRPVLLADDPNDPDWSRRPENLATLLAYLEDQCIPHRASMVVGDARGWHREFVAAVHWLETGDAA